MKKTFRMIDLDCANCAAKMERAIQNIDGVTSATVSFMTQKLTLEADDARFDQIVKEAVKNLKTLAARIDTDKMKKPSFLMVLTGTGRFAFKREDGVLEVPVCCLKD